LFLLTEGAGARWTDLGTWTGFPLPNRDAGLLGGEKWGAGPTAVGLVQKGAWTVGALANHIWSFAGDDDRSNISATFLQPFVAYTTKTHTTFTVNTESTY